MCSQCRLEYAQPHIEILYVQAYCILIGNVLGKIKSVRWWNADKCRGIADPDGHHTDIDSIDRCEIVSNGHAGKAVQFAVNGSEYGIDPGNNIIQPCVYQIHSWLQGVLDRSF